MTEEVPKAKKEPGWIRRHKILSTVVGVSLFLLILAVANSGGSPSPSPSNEVTQSQPSDDMEVGQEGYLRLPNISDPKQVICLGSTKDEANQISKALLAKDFLGILEIPGAFCIGNGSKALLIEKSFPLRKVRITQGINEVDSDKVGRSGWLPLEWVVAQ